jgi:Tol biopolymer transport system component
MVCAIAGAGRGGTWNRAGAIIFAIGGSQTGPLYRVSADGGTPAAITKLEPARKEDAHYYPQFLPDGKRFLYFRRGTESGIFLGRLDDPDQGSADKQVLRTDHQAIYATSIFGGPVKILHVRGASLFIQPFDPDAGKLAGEATVVAEAVFRTPTNGFVDVSAADNGTISYSLPVQEQSLGWRGRSGEVQGSRIGIGSVVGDISLSPDGNKVVSFREDLTMWITDLSRETISRTPFRAGVPMTVWSPDSERVAFSSGGGIRIAPADGSTQGEVVLPETNIPARMTDWSKDGRYLVFDRYQQGMQTDIWVLSYTGDRKPFPAINTGFEEAHGVVSPDGRWLAYRSNETGDYEIYIQGFPAAQGRWMVSKGGGSGPQWRGDGKELVYLGTNGMMMSVSVQSTSEGLRAGKPVELMRGDANTRMSSDGKRFLTVEAAQGSAKRSIVVLSNWQR